MSTSSSFLCLPAELCNQIYKLVLISPKLLILASKYDGRATLLLFEIDGVMREFNQLKYVNKQIFKDIKNIELSYNDIMVHRTKLEDDPPAAQFLSWVYRMMSSTRSWLNGATIVLADGSNFRQLSDIDMPDSARTISYLARFCNAHTAVTVHYHLPELNFATDDDGNEEDSLRNLDWDIFQSALAACFYIPALINENIKLGPSFDPWFDVWRVAERIREAEYWKAQNEGFGVGQLQARNMHYLPSKVRNIELVREGVEAWFGSGSETAYVIMNIAEYGLKASLDIIKSE
jgi:hypothetical protein